jgi:hypothetical protein
LTKVGDLCTVSLPALLMLWASADMRRVLLKPFKRLVGGLGWLRDLIGSGRAVVGPSSIMPTLSGPNQNPAAELQQSTCPPRFNRGTI